VGKIRKFDTGATRDDDEGKFEPWGFTSALVEKAYSAYMHKNRLQPDGEMRPSNNWTKGIPIPSYWHSLSRHVEDFRLIYEGFPREARTQDILETLMAIKFNVEGLAYELLKSEYEAANDSKH
jgi:hypothetical protein